VERFRSSFAVRKNFRNFDEFAKPARSF